MIREKIFRLHRHKSSSSSSSATNDSSAHKFDFAFSNIQAIQVPKGWDKITLSLISSESGKTVRKTGKVPVKNGTCHWTETFSESVWISGSKEPEEYLFKFVLAAGSSKSSSLGEFTVNLAAFLSSSSPMLVSLPLKKSDYGTILQVEVKCLTPRTNLRGEKWKEMQENMENEDQDENQSEVSDSTSNIGKLSSRETSFSASVSRYSFDSTDDSLGRRSFSSQSRQDSIESNDSASFSARGSVKSVRSQGKNQASLVQELEVEKLRKDVANRNVELERSRLECREFSREIERLRSELEEANVKRSDDDQSSAWSDIHKEELRDEMKFQKEDYDNMSIQFRKTQESNIELISILREMEETIEGQKIELVSARELRRALEERIVATEMEQDLKNRIVKMFVVECNDRLAAKEEEIINLDRDLHMFQELKQKVRELTDQNLDLLFELELRTSNSDETSGDLRLMEHLSELEEENVYLSQRVNGLEAQLRYLTDESETSRSELQRSEAKVGIFECRMRRLEEEMESQKIDMKEKLMEKEKLLEEGQEECTSLSKMNIMLQCTIENLIDEYNSLQSFDGEVREQKMKLQERCLDLESEARKNLDGLDEDSKVMMVISELETKIKVSEIERVRLAEENSLMSMKLQKMAKMESEVLGSRVLVREMKSRNQLLEGSFRSLSEDYERAKWEKVCMLENTKSMQRLVVEAEEIKRKKNLLEEKVLRLEGDLIAKDALRLEDLEIKNEMNRIKIANSKLTMKVKHLEEIRCDSTTEFRPNDRGQIQVLNKEESSERCEKLETELEEIRERYFEISLKYAEVEAQREELVMKLKAH